LKHAIAVTFFGAILFFVGLALGFAEGNKFGATLVSVNTGFVASNSLNAMKNDRIEHVQTALEYDVEAGFMAGAVLRQNPRWAWFGYLTSPNKKADVDKYLGEMQKYRDANAFDFSSGCAEVDCKKTN
jgi:hypothetical protein